jgi:hypothetical protein
MALTRVGETGRRATVFNPVVWTQASATDYPCRLSIVTPFFSTVEVKLATRTTGSNPVPGTNDIR